ncbi:hypothetical protein K439DRAFT_1286976, partial [Ramaria rubella]
LYYPVNATFDSIKEQNGRRLYEQFGVLVLLDQQVRVSDVAWLDFLRHLRYGNVKEHHIKMLKNLVLTNKHCRTTDFENGPWKDASLVTPRHAVRTRWNAAMLRKHCKDTKQTLFVCPAFDTINQRRPNLGERYAMATRRERKQRGRESKNGLPDKVEIALGMKVMVTTNIDTDLDVANGSRGEIVGIALDPREEKTGSSAIVALEYPPTYILVKLQRTRS